MGKTDAEKSMDALRAHQLKRGQQLLTRTKGLLEQVLLSQGADADMRLLELRSDIDHWLGSVSAMEPVNRVKGGAL